MNLSHYIVVVFSHCLSSLGNVGSKSGNHGILSNLAQRKTNPTELMA